MRSTLNEPATNVFYFTLII